MRGLICGALLALALAGCGSDDQPSSPAPQSGDEMGVKFAQCMREHGVDMPDPEPGKGVQLKFDKGTDRAAVDKALEACREFNPQADGPAVGDSKAEEAARKFAECMRQNGIEDFPDPKPGQRGVLMDEKTTKDPDFPQAQEKCKDILAGGR